MKSRFTLHIVGPTDCSARWPEEGLRDLEARLSAPLQTMAGAGEIASGQVEIPRDQNLAAGMITPKVRIVPIDTVREISVDIGFSAGGGSQ